MNSKSNYIYTFYIFFALLILFIFRFNPLISIFLSSLILLIYIILRLKKKYSFFLLIYPFTIYFISFFYNKNFLSLGDNEGYYGPLMDTLPFYGKAQDNARFLSNLTSLDGLQYLKLGFLPVIIVPDFLYKIENEIVYYYFQSFYFLFLVTYLVFYISKYKILEDNKLNYLILFLLLSPSCISLGIAPTRHYFTLFSIILFFFAFINYNSTKNKKHLITIFIAIIFTLISKAGYIFGYLLFIIFFYRNLFKIKKYILNLIYILSFIIFILLFVYILPRYNDITTSGLASLNWVLKIPLIGPFSKYIFNILSPFPHYNFISLSNLVFGGNILYFIFHILGILYILVVIINLSNYFIKRNKEDNLDVFTLYGCIMSLTILPASAGFNGYISIFYPFFIFYFNKKNITKKLFISLFILTMINIIFFTYSFFK